MSDKVVKLVSPRERTSQRGRATMLKMLDEARAEVETGEVTTLVLGFSVREKFETNMCLLDSRLAAMGLGAAITRHAHEAEIEPLDEVPDGEEG